MAVSLQNLFSLESEDFDDEDFLSVLEDTESSTPCTVPTKNRRLRPISYNTSQLREDSKGIGLKPCLATRQPPEPSLVAVRSGGSQRAPYCAQDVDDEELLSLCSELEEVPGAHCQISESRGISKAEIGASNQSNSCKNNSSVFQLRPTANAHSLVHGSGQGFPRTPSGTSKCPNMDTNSPSGYQSCLLEPTAKKPCLSSTDTLFLTPRRGPSPVSRELQSTTQKEPPGNSLQLVNGQAWQHVSPVDHAHSTPQMSRSTLTSPRVLTPSSLQTPVVTNHLLQLVTAANQIPRRLSWETPTPKERKFPGPAGLLPQQMRGRALEEILVSAPHTPSHGARARLCSKEASTSQQTGEENFIRGPWATMKGDLGLDENDPGCFLRTYSVVMVLRKAALKQLQKNKVPQMAVILKSLTPANGDASAVFRDPTGDIQGTVHHLLLEERESELKIGSVLLLKQVGVFSPSHRNHYLNVTPNNIVKIYPPGEECRTPRFPVQPTSEDTDLNSNETLHPRPSSSTTQNKAPQPPASADWDADDLDGLLCDLPEDPGD
ncbi:homologous recombination OB-fold protein [Spea bombifrons]|uniref:homologous recombination OB-fold protein n=1 Tax=Spea bombifrons TaxID=233779 RepID=UPI00234A14A8|nr:homologous recombination OB-fold protein [Spea bombifrons]